MANPRFAENFECPRVIRGVHQYCIYTTYHQPIVPRAFSAKPAHMDTNEMCQENNDWRSSNICDLPSHLWEMIFGMLRGNTDASGRRDMFAVTAVCREWRQLAFHQFFQHQWYAPSDIIHPLQLLQLSNRAVPGHLLQCYVLREKLSRFGMGKLRFSMFLASADASDCAGKFLLAAYQRYRNEITVHMDRQCKGPAIARIRCSMSQVIYSATTTTACPLPFVTHDTQPRLQSDLPAAATSGPCSTLNESTVRPGPTVARLPPVLARCKYAVRLKSFMRPRRIVITLPNPVELACFEADSEAAVQRLSDVSDSCPLPPGLVSGSSAPSATEMSHLVAPGDSNFAKLKRTASGPARSLLKSVQRSMRLSRSSVTSASASATAPASLSVAQGDDALEELHNQLPSSTLTIGEGAPSSSHGRSPSCMDGNNSGSSRRSMSRSRNKSEACQHQQLPMGLCTKSPNWNPNIRSHCLNFHGRVKIASVKNYQLTAMNPAMTAALFAAAEPAPSGRRPRGGRSSRTVVMQFGKEAESSYILDYNPTMLSGLQAFCIALTNFNTKLIL